MTPCLSLGLTAYPVLSFLCYAFTTWHARTHARLFYSCTRLLAGGQVYGRQSSRWFPSFFFFSYVYYWVFLGGLKARAFLFHFADGGGGGEGGCLGCLPGRNAMVGDVGTTKLFDTQNGSKRAGWPLRYPCEGSILAWYIPIYLYEDTFLLVYINHYH